MQLPDPLGRKHEAQLKEDENQGSHPPLQVQEGGQVGYPQGLQLIAQ